MKLTKVSIKNFRSIEELEMNFDPTCRVLVGINESGKSNILRALSMLGEDHEPTSEDVRENLPDEDPVTESTVEFIFSLEDEDYEEIYDNSQAAFLGFAENDKIVKTKNEEKELNLKQLYKSIKSAIYNVDVIAKDKKAMYYRILGYDVLSHVKKPSENCPAEYTVEKENKESIVLKQVKFINTKIYKDIPKEYLQSTTLTDIEEEIGDKITDRVDDVLPDTLFWEYKEANLLPSKVDLDQFIENPDICLPLKHMFILANYENIKQAITDAQKTNKGLKNLLKKVADTATRHLHSVWKDYKKVTIELAPDGTNIDASIKDTFNSFGMNQRSDGFKRFVTFLLMVSTKVQSDLLSDTLILIDEPEISLHPSGTRHLRDELIKISHKNYVVYSTHSIFMIDKDNLKRHIIVEKEGEKTQTKVADESNIVTEEVLYNALGYSIFESLKRKNIIFEGWNDARLFKVAYSKVPSEHSGVKNLFREVGICHAVGVKDISKIAALLQLADRNCLIVSDNDDAAKRLQSVYKKEKYFGKWERYNEIDSGLNVITGEDFIKANAVLDAVNEVKNQLQITTDITEAELVVQQGKIYAIEKWLGQNGVNGEQKKEAVKQIKDKIFTNLKHTQVEPIYYSFMEKLGQKIALEQLSVDEIQPQAQVAEE